ncbi:hypothetical protein [Nocardia sp. NPDC020380]|uniref:hypothetical protein n=1 Tax=Nocardia sp. NPDC020380 TaxID=3364309 RepID=UPI00378C8E51
MWTTPALGSAAGQGKQDRLSKTQILLDLRLLECVERDGRLNRLIEQQHPPMNCVDPVAATGPVEPVLFNFLDPLFLLVQPDDQIARYARDRVLNSLVGDIDIDG